MNNMPSPQPRGRGDGQKGLPGARRSCCQEDQRASSASGDLKCRNQRLADLENPGRAELLPQQSGLSAPGLVTFHWCTLWKRGFVKGLAFHGRQGRTQTTGMLLLEATEGTRASTWGQ